MRVKPVALLPSDDPDAAACPPCGVGGGGGEPAASGVGPVQGGGVIMEEDGGGAAAAAADVGELLTREIKKRLLVHARENGNGHVHVNGGEAEEL